MNIKVKLVINALFLGFTMHSQNVTNVYKISELINRIDTSARPTVINFWATWCKPCVQELPSFDSLTVSSNTSKVILVSLDFKEDIDKKVNPFLKKNKVLSDCVLLDEVNGNDYINQISEQWTGAIPATLFIYKRKKIFVEKKLHLLQMEDYLAKLKKEN